MNVAQRITGNIAVITLSGKMIESIDTGDLFDRIKNIVDHDVYQVIMDLHEVKWINSVGVGALMGCLSYLEAHNCDLKLVQMSPKVRSVLAMMDIFDYFQDYKSINSAVISRPN
jgi:anti-sigma B factor antagonist